MRSEEANPPATLKVESVESLIHELRGQKVMLDSDLAALYGADTRVLNQAVRRQINRFPEDFAFRISKDEFINLKSQIVISSWGGRRKLPYAFTEQGVAMLSSVLNSSRAIQVNIEIMRAFVSLRGLVASHSELAKRIDALESKYDEQFKVVFEAIRQLMAPPAPSQKRIGFRVGEKRKQYGAPSNSGVKGRA